MGVCRGCGAYTQPRNGKGDAYAYCKACHPGAIERRWTSRASARRDARVAQAPRAAADVIRLVAHARASPWRRAARATQHRRLAFRRRRGRGVRELEGSTGCGRQAHRPGRRRRSTVAAAAFLTTHCQPGGRSSPTANAHGCERSGCASSGFRAGNAVPKKECFPAAIERGAVSWQPRSESSVGCSFECGP